MKHHVWVTQLRVLDLAIEADSREDAERLARQRLSPDAAEPWVVATTIVRVGMVERKSNIEPTPVTSAPRELWPVAIAAERLGVSRTTIYGLLKDGALGSVNIGRRRFIAEEQLRHYIAQRTIIPPAASSPDTR